jgi:hypothetical protein
MKKIALDNCICIFYDGELERVYETDGTVNDIVKALEDYGYYNHYNENDWEYGIGTAPVKCHSLEDIATAIIEESYFEDSDGDLFIGRRGYTPN